MLPNEVFALACRAYYDEIGLIVDERNGEFAHCPYPEGMGETGYYLLHGHHQHQGLLQSKDVGRCCYFVGHAKKWLVECDYWPDDYFELWDIFDHYTSQQSRETIKKTRKRYPQRFIEGSRSAGLVGVSRGSGIHNPEYRESEEYKSINRQAGRNGGETGKKRKSGIHDPEYRESDEYLTMRSKESKKLVEREVGIFDPAFKKKQNQECSKPVVFHFPDGSTQLFPSRMEAIRQKKMSSSTLVRVLRNGKAIASGRFKGVWITEAKG